LRPYRNVMYLSMQQDARWGNNPESISGTAVSHDDDTSMST